LSDDLDRHRRVRAVFEQVRDEAPERRMAVLASACGDDASLYDEVAGLLSADQKADAFLEVPAVAALAAAPRLIGRQLGPYEVLTVVGVGGMGEVYRARDQALGREVALKVLPELFAQDPDRLARFDREARILASLNHPHIAAIYGIEDGDGVRALVLELVEGETLAERIVQGPIPRPEALAIARQIGQALAAAHEQGVVHRDLKPANVKIRPDGTVKVLDFGLARTVGPDVADVPTTRATMSVVTEMGLVMGTPGYLSPEQATGRPADKRSDIWAFGCVLYEMLTGRRVFEGAHLSESMALVLTREPDWERLPADTPPAILRLLRRCLEKDRDRRLADIADARLELDERDDAPARDLRSRSRWPWGLAAAGLLAAAWLGTMVVRRGQPADTKVYRSSILLSGRLGQPLKAPFDNRSASLALSPDGRRLAFVATETNGRTQLWLRSLDSGMAQPLGDTAGAVSPFWSPDSRWLAFVANGALRKIDVSGGGPAVTVCESAWAGGAWSGNDVILFTDNATRSLARVPAAGGAPTLATSIEAGELAHLFPSFLPGNRQFVYAAVSGPAQTRGLYIGSLDSTSRTRVALDAPFVQYAQGYLWFSRGSTLMAVPFDAARGTSGTALPMAEQLRLSGGYAIFSVSPSGALVFQTDTSPGYDLTWFDRTGRPAGNLGTRDDYGDVSLSPDGGRALVSVGESGTGNRDLWIFDVSRGVRTRLTSDPAPETHNAWSPDGARVAFDRRTPGRFGIYEVAASGASDARTLLADGLDDNPCSWSPDGRALLYVRREGGTTNIWVLPLEGERKPFPFTRTQFNVPGQFSPDGRWVAYGSNDSGRMEIYVASFPDGGSRSLVSTAGGWDPRWRRDGKEILYMDQSTRKLMSVRVEARSGRVDIGEAKALFDLPKVGQRSTYDVSADGQKILAVTRQDDAGASPLTLVVNWPALLAK
jgi:serine/threonine protein kinase